jgi:polyketide biosynthesis acyl carrier protein
MNQQAIIEVIVQHAREVLPSLAERSIGASDSLRALGANSIDRSEILMMTLETLGLNMPLMELARAENIGQLAGLIHVRSAGA